MKIQSGNIAPLNLGPQQETTVALPIKVLQPKPGARYHLNVSMELGKDALWQKAGYVVAGGQMEMPMAAPARVINSIGMKPVKIVGGIGGSIAVSGDGFQVVFNRATGQITQLSRGGVNVLLPNGGPTLHLWRAPHHMYDEWANSNWEQMGLKAMTIKALNIEAHQVSPSQIRVDATVLYTGKSGFSVTHAISHNIFGDGSVVVNNAVMPQGSKIALARVGVQMLLDKRLGNLDYLARSPMENYSDCKRGSDIGHCTSTVAQQMTPYSKPEDCGNYEDTS